MDVTFDLAIIGGGINGCGCAADATLRGLSVALLEKDDLASQTSSSSTKLIHGGLRYLEHYEFNLVRKALTERQRLLELAPHLIRPQPFVLAYQKYMRPAWMLRLGLFLYDFLSLKNRLPKCKSISRSNKMGYFLPLQNQLQRGFLFYDASTDDARLTLANALLAKNHGASIRTNSQVIDIQQKASLWELTILPKQGSSYKLYAKAIINAAGPWVETLNKHMQITSHPMTFVQGSHIVVQKMYDGEQAYLLQNPDNRVVFVIPYNGFTMIGTTDVLFQGSFDNIYISEAEINYLLTSVDNYFTVKPTKEDIVYSWSGVRPLLAQQHTILSKLSRDYYFEVSKTPLPSVTIYSGKLTTYRQLAEDVIDGLRDIFPNMLACKTKCTPLPGANLNTMNFESFVTYATKKYAWLGPQLLNRYLYTYGSCMDYFLSTCTNFESMGKKFGDSLYQVEVDYLVSAEFATTCEDILKRRTNLFLYMDERNIEELEGYLMSLK
ncbi:MAG: glycerol-3-phosphate dehydrogenase [Legionella sp.]|nr:glycerol-3-phosphate dehydrogenase [Legionella sp.]